jgi:hypothetical protein
MKRGGVQLPISNRSRNFGFSSSTELRNDRLNASRADGIHPDALSRVFKGSVLGQAINGMLRCHIGAKPGESDQASNGSNGVGSEAGPRGALDAKGADERLRAVMAIPQRNTSAIEKPADIPGRETFDPEGHYATPFLCILRAQYAHPAKSLLAHQADALSARCS